MQEDGQPQVCKKTIKTTEHCPNLVQSLVQLFKKNMCSLETLAQLLVLQMVMVTAYGAQRNISWIENLEQVLNPPWKCHIPKARLVYMNAEVKGFDADASYFPPAVVLHRCDNSVGCCSMEGYTCAPAKKEAVTFEIREHSTVREFSFVNHTRCICKYVKDLYRLD